MQRQKGHISPQKRCGHLSYSP